MEPKTLKDTYVDNIAFSEKMQKIVLSYVLSGFKHKEIIYQVKDYWFLNVEYRKIYTIAREAIVQNKEVWNSLLEKGVTTETIVSLATGTDDVVIGVDNVVSSLKNAYKRDRFYALIDEFNLMYTNDTKDTDEMIQKAYNKLVKMSSDNQEDVSVEDIISEFLEVQDQFIQKGTGGYIGIPTGFPKIDNTIDGLREGHLWVIGAYTSAGKTWFMLNVLNNILTHPCTLFSLEMSRVEIINRLLAIETKIGATQILRNDLPFEDQKESVERAKNRLIDSKLKIIDGDIELSEMITRMTYDIIKRGTKVFFIDYLQLIDVKGATGDYEETSKVSKVLQRFAQKMKVTIVCLSQVNNEHAKTPNKEVIGMKGGGTIAASGDIVIELINSNNREERDERYANNLPYEIVAIIKKNRHGRTGEIDMTFNPRNGVFEQRETIEDWGTQQNDELAD